MSNKYLDIAMEKVIKQEVNKVLDKIRAEIEQIEGNEVEVSDMQGNRYKYETIVKAEVLQVIDKYKAESEEN